MLTTPICHTYFWPCAFCLCTQLAKYKQVKVVNKYTDWCSYSIARGVCALVEVMVLVMLRALSYSSSMWLKRKWMNDEEKVARDSRCVDSMPTKKLQFALDVGKKLLLTITRKLLSCSYCVVLLHIYPFLEYMLHPDVGENYYPQPQGSCMRLSTIMQYYYSSHLLF